MATFTLSGSRVTVTASSGILSVKNVYSDLASVRRYLTLASENTSDDNALKEFLRHASRTIDKYCNRHFYPNRKVNYYTLPNNRYNLIVEHDLLQSYGLSHINGQEQVDNSVYWLKCGDDWNRTPYDRIELDRNSGSTFNFSGTPQRAIHLDGIWGYHEDYDNAWVDSGASLTADISNGTVTMASVSGSTGQNVAGLSPRITADQIWKVDDEYMHVVTSEDTSSIRVIRGINGTTATSHASGATIYTWDVEPDIAYAARELTAFQYITSKSPRTQRIATPGLGGFSIDIPETWPPQTIDKLQRFKKRRVYSI